MLHFLVPEICFNTPICPESERFFSHSLSFVQRLLHKLGGAGNDAYQRLSLKQCQHTDIDIIIFIYMHLVSTIALSHFYHCSMHLVAIFASLLLVYHTATTFDVMKYASIQYSILYQEFIDSAETYYPSSGNPLEEEWNATGPTEGWTQGFFPGVLWNLVEYNATREGLKQAIDVTAPTAAFANYTSQLGVGLVIMSGFGNGYRLLKRPDYLDVVVKGAHTLATRYSPIVRCTRSWNTPEGFLVIMDNMMSLEILFEAANQTNNQTLYNIGWQHANRTMYEHFRENNSTYHVVEYNETDGSVVRKFTAQGNRKDICTYFVQLMSR